MKTVTLKILVIVTLFSLFNEIVFHCVFSRYSMTDKFTAFALEIGNFLQLYLEFSPFTKITFLIISLLPQEV